MHVAIAHEGSAAPVPALDGLPYVSSVVGCTHGRALVGAPARAHFFVEPAEVLFGPARHLGGGRVTLGGQEYDPEDLVARLLEQAAAAGQVAARGSIDGVALSRAAWATPEARKALAAAAQRAGLHVIRTEVSTTLAAVAQLGERNPVGLAAFVDVGGWKIETTVFSIEPGVVRALGRSVDATIGANWLDGRLVKALVHQIAPDDERKLLKDRLCYAMLREQCESLRVQLSSQTNTDVALPFLQPLLGRNQTPGWRVERRFLETLAQPLIEAIRVVCGEALESAGVEAGQIREVFVHGGLAHMPVVRDTVGDYFGRPAAARGDVDSLAARGAALIGTASLGQLRLKAIDDLDEYGHPPAAAGWGQAIPAYVTPAPEPLPSPATPGHASEIASPPSPEPGRAARAHAAAPPPTRLPPPVPRPAHAPAPEPRSHPSGERPSHGPPALAGARPSGESRGEAFGTSSPPHTLPAPRAAPAPDGFAGLEPSRQPERSERAAGRGAEASGMKTSPGFPHERPGHTPPAPAHEPAATPEPARATPPAAPTPADVGEAASPPPLPDAAAGTPSPSARGREPTLPSEGTIRNAPDPATLAAIPLDGPLPLASPLSLPVLLLAIGRRRSFSGQLRLKRGTLEHGVYIVRGGAAGTSLEMEQLRRTFEWPDGSYKITADTPSSRLVAARQPMVAVVVHGIRSCLRVMDIRQVLDVLAPHLREAPRVRPSRAAIVPLLGLSPRELRFVEHLLDGANSADEILRRGGIGRETAVHLLFVLQLFRALEWLSPEGRPGESPADQLRLRARKLEKADHFEALGVHWSVSRAEIDRALARIEEELKPGGRTSQIEPDAAARILARARRAHAAVARESDRRAYLLEIHPDLDFDAIESVAEDQNRWYAWRGATEATEETARLKHELLELSRLQRDQPKTGR
ncbi:MAG: Hsp70 family protein [Deltaproteobacteria bacterium]|nr:Hsp70 family protein [Deltaproteobacteria bacterium]